MTRLQGTAEKLDITAECGARFEADGDEGFGFIETRGYKFRAILCGPEDGVPLIFSTAQSKLQSSIQPAAHGLQARTRQDRMQ